MCRNVKDMELQGTLNGQRKAAQQVEAGSDFGQLCISPRR